MSIQSAPFYWAVCDCCGTRCPYGDEYAAWATEESALDYSMDQFERVGDEDLCPQCWCWPEDLSDYPGDEAWQGTDDPVRRHVEHSQPNEKEEES